MARYLTLAELHDGMEKILQSPSDDGILSAIVVRPEKNERTSARKMRTQPTAWSSRR